MVRLLRRGIELIETFLVKAPPLWVGVALIAFGVLGFEGMVTYNQSSNFCMECHRPMGIFISFDEDHDSHVPYKQDKTRCLACHTDKDFYSFAFHLARRAGDGFTRVTNENVVRLPKQDPGYTDAQCLTCHYNVLKLEKAEKLELPERLAGIGLTFSHRNHFWIKDFPSEAGSRLRELQAMAERKKEEQEELEFLLRARLGRCAQCHDREKPAAAGGAQIDRTVNFFSINPMRCVGCHTDATRDRHPGTIHLALPREETCRRCHTGTFHGRFTMFRAECESRDQRHCRRCHPGYQPEINANTAVAQAAANLL